MHKTLTLLAAAAGLALVSPALANDVQKDTQDIQADVGAIHKDNNDETLKQAGDSTRIGAVQTAISEKEAERNVDRDQLAEDQKELREDKAKAASQQ